MKYDCKQKALASNVLETFEEPTLQFQNQEHSHLQKKKSDSRLKYEIQEKKKKDDGFHYIIFKLTPENQQTAKKNKTALELFPSTFLIHMFQKTNSFPARDEVSPRPNSLGRRHLASSQ